MSRSTPRTEIAEAAPTGGARGWRGAALALGAALCALAAAGCEDASASWATDTRVISTFGRQPGQVSKPRAVAVSRDGELVVVDRTGRIQVFDLETGAYLRRWQLQDHTNGTPTGIDIDPVDQTLWVADTHYQRILNYDLAGNLLSSFGEHGEGPGQFVFPTDVAVSPDGSLLYVTEYGRRNRLMIFKRDGQFVREWGAELYDTSDLDRPQALALAPDGRVLVADAGNHQVMVFSPQGELLERWGSPGSGPGQLKYPYDLAMDGEGRLYVCEYGNNRVSLFSPEGEPIAFFGGPGHAPAQFFMPWGVAVGPGGAVIVADSNNGRVQVLDRGARAFQPAAREGS